jgi:hypothetical protein
MVVQMFDSAGRAARWGAKSNRWSREEMTAPCAAFHRSFVAQVAPDNLDPQP